MPENRTRPSQRKRKKRRSIFKLSVILLIFIVCIVWSFVKYAIGFDISSKPSAVSTSTDQPPVQENVIVTDTDGNAVTDTDGNMVTEQNEVTVPNNINNTGTGNPVKETTPKDESYLENSVFIGDSITTGLSGYKFVPSKNVLASIGLRVDNVTMETVENPLYSEPVKVLDALFNIRPENVYILLGSNGVAWYDNDKMITAYSAFIDSIKEELPDTDVYIISITPVGTIKENIETKENGKVLNSEIDDFNLRLLDLANQKGVYYLDVNSQLKGENGKLPDDVTKDGMHFNKDTYEVFVNYILSHTA